MYKAREAWHLQKTDPPGTRSKEYLKQWAKKYGGTKSLFELKYVKDTNN
jgi:hypothetical protein